MKERSTVSAEEEKQSRDRSPDQKPDGASKTTQRAELSPVTGRGWHGPYRLKTSDTHIGSEPWQMHALVRLIRRNRQIEDERVKKWGMYVKLY